MEGTGEDSSSESASSGGSESASSENSGSATLADRNGSPSSSSELDRVSPQYEITGWRFTLSSVSLPMRDTGGDGCFEGIDAAFDWCAVGGLGSAGKLRLIGGLDWRDWGVGLLRL